MTLVYWLLGLDSPQMISGVTEAEWYAASPLPLALVIFIALIAVAASGLNLLRQNVMPWRTRIGLTFLRLAGFALLLAMLSRLEIRLTCERVMLPNVAVLTDTSASMGLRDVGGKSRLQAAREFGSGPLRDLSVKANVAQYTLDWRLKEDDGSVEPSGMTRLFETLREAGERERDLKAAVLLTDGNDTEGDKGELLAPILAARGLPVYPVVFGEESAPRLAKVRIATGVPYVRLGDELPVSAVLSATNLGEQNVRVQLMEEGRNNPVAARENVRLGDEPVEVRFIIKPNRVGPITYRVVMQGVRGTVGDREPVAEYRVVVIDAKIRVLYLDVPRDERKLVAHWLARDPVVDLGSLTMLPKGGWYAQGALWHKNAGDGIPNKEADLYQYDVVILGDIPRAYFRSGGDIAETKLQWLGEFVTRRGGGLITLGGRAVYGAGRYQDSALARLIPFEIESTDEPQVPKPFHLSLTPMGFGHPIMRLEYGAEANREAWFDLPTLDGCNRVGRTKPGASLLAFRQSDKEVVPVVAVQNVGKGKVLSLSVDTTWRWEMMRPPEAEDHFRRFWGNAVRFLAPDPRIGPHRPQTLRYRSNTPVGQSITLATRLVDTLYKPVCGADLVVRVTSPSGKGFCIYPRDGRGAPGLYEYEVELDEAGEWAVATTYKDQTTVEKIVAGSSVEELDDPRARPDAMRDFAEATGGKVFSPEQGAALLAELDLSPRRFQQTSSLAIWNLPLTMLLFIVFVCVDCLVRKRRGMV